MRDPGSLDLLEDRLRYGLIGTRDQTVSSPTRVWSTWSAFRADPLEAAWRRFVYRLAMLVGEPATLRILGGVDPWPEATKAELDSVDAFWSIWDIPEVGVSGT